MPGEESSFKATQDAISKCLVDATRTASQIAQEDLTFQRTSNPAAMRQLDQQNARILSMAQSLTHQAAAGTTAEKPSVKSLEGLDDNWKAIVDVVDSLLEKADACLDEFTGFIKQKPLADNTDAAEPMSMEARKEFHLSKAIRDADLLKPQLHFHRPTNNFAPGPFRPLLRTKPHATVPFEQSLAINKDTSQYEHPYQPEIEQYTFPPSTYTRAEPIPYLPLDSTSAALVDTPEGVMEMLAELKQASVIAIDLEHHDKHSYIGLVSLMQISTRDKDWVVDTLKPWREDLQVLNEVFTDPSIIKVFHGAFMDMVWLQRDFGLYVVGLFDTYHAADALHYPGKGLAYLLKRFTGFNAQKKYQMADWRIRPLPTDMFHYARCDTHFLLFVYDNMRNELIDSSIPSQPDGDLIQQVLEGSKKETLQVYEVPEYDSKLGIGSGGWYNQVCKTPKSFSKQQFAVFRALHSWRDHVAREEDEGITTVLPRGALFNITQHLPIDMQTLRSCCRSDSDIFKRRAGELLEIIKHSKDSSQNEPDMAEFLESHPETVRRAEAAAAWKERQEALANPAPSAPAEPPAKETLGGSIRTTLSRFWGGSLAQPNRKHSTQAATSKVEDEVRLSIPLPKLNADVFETYETNGQGVSIAASATPSALVEHEYIKERLQQSKAVDSDVFVIRGSKKRKSMGDESGEGHSEKTQSIHAANQQAFEDNQSINQAQTKAERKALKAQRKLENTPQATNGLQQNGDGIQPFDYTNAPSVLHSKNELPSAQRNGVNPYSKSLNAPKGMRKANPELAGKSFTFKK